MTRGKDKYDEVYQECIEQHLSKHLSNRLVRIAVLDTGVESKHSSIEAYNQPRGIRNYYNKSRNDLPNTHRHRTFAVNVILDYTPSAYRNNSEPLKCGRYSGASLLYEEDFGVFTPRKSSMAFDDLGTTVKYIIQDLIHGLISALF